MRRAKKFGFPANDIHREHCIHQFPVTGHALGRNVNSIMNVFGATTLSQSNEESPLRVNYQAVLAVAKSGLLITRNNGSVLLVLPTRSLLMKTHHPTINLRRVTLLAPNLLRRHQFEKINGR